MVFSPHPNTHAHCFLASLPISGGTKRPRGSACCGCACTTSAPPRARCDWVRFKHRIKISANPIKNNLGQSMQSPSVFTKQAQDSGQENQRIKTNISKNASLLAYLRSLFFRIVCAPSPTPSPDTAADRRGARIGAVAAALCEFKAFLAAKAQRLPRAAVDVLTQVNESAIT